jgi:nucleoside-diphosphate-sugar epimerase
MKIFVTGAPGFIGRNVVELLSSGSNKLLLLAKDKGEHRLLDRYKQNVITGDLKNISYLKKDIKNFNPQVLIHLAWKGIPDFSFNMCKKNLDISLALINFIINETDCKKIIVSGSCLEYGRTNGRCKETDSVNINSCFSWAKFSLYSYLNFICRKFDKDLIWFRIFYAYGPGQRKESLIPNLIYAFKKGTKPNISGALNANDFIHVEDIAHAFCKAVDKKIKSGIYNLGSGKPTRVIDICKTAEKIISGKNRISDKIALNLNFKETLNFWADITKTKKTLSWKPGISVEKGIRSYLREEENYDYL